MDRYFTRKGVTRTATTPAQAVRLKYDGWTEVVALPAPEAPVESVTEAAEGVINAEQALATAEAAAVPPLGEPTADVPPLTPEATP